MENNLIRKKNQLFEYLLIVISFVILSLIGICVIWYNNKLFFIQEDSFFHLGRIEELIRSKHIFPIYSLNSFNFVGSAVNLMYPYLLLYPMVILFKITKSIKNMVLIYYVAMSFIALFIAFFSSLKFSKSKLTSYLFSIIYVFSGELMAMYFYSHVTDVGVYLSALFLPLVIFGFIYFLKYGKWMMLSIGMALILYSNVISVTFLSVLLFILLLINYKFINKMKIINLFKAITLMALSTACLWVPIIKLSLLNKMNVPTTGSSSIGVIGFRALISTGIKNNFLMGCQALSIFSLLGIVFGLIFFKYLTHFIKQLYLFSIFIIIFSSKIFPWNLFSKIIAFRHLQTTIRMLVVPQLLLEFIIAFIIANFIQNRKKYAARIICLTIILFVIIGCQIRNQDMYVATGNHITTNSGRLAHNMNQIVNNNRWLVYSTNIHRITFSSLRMGNSDYWPKMPTSLRNQLFNEHIVNKNENVKFIPKGNGNFYFKNYSKLTHLTLPFLYYYGTNYQCYLNGDPVKFRPSKNQLMTINNVKRGNNHVLIKVNLDKTLIVSRGLSIISIPIYIFIILKKRERITNNINHLEEGNHA